MPFRICVVCADYSESNGALSEVDNIERTPAFHCTDPNYIFETLKVHKKDVYPKLRAAAQKTTTIETSNGNKRKRRYYDCFFIIADGALDEDRAGVEVLHVLERFGCPFTGARSAFYELTKPEMKVLAMRNGIDTARFAVVEETDDVRQSCGRLEFPVIVKHISGYSSVGMTKRNKCKNMEELESCCNDFIAEYQSALVEEFVTGLEVTALACGDSSQPSGVHVYPPVYVTFPEGEDFKHFDLKWLNYEDMVWKQLPESHPAFAEVVRVTRVAFQSMMNGVGYGRVDLRIDARTNKVVLLEINPNCGIMYPLGQEASADFILDLAHAREDFVKLQIHEALHFHERTVPAFQVRLDGSRDNGWTTKATRYIPKGASILSLLADPQQQQQHSLDNNHNNQDKSNQKKASSSSAVDDEAELIQQQQMKQEAEKKHPQQNNTVGVRLTARNDDEDVSKNVAASTTTAPIIASPVIVEDHHHHHHQTAAASALSDSPTTSETSSLLENPVNNNNNHNSNKNSPTSAVVAQLLSKHTDLDSSRQNSEGEEELLFKTSKFGVALHDPALAYTNIIGGGAPFPKANKQNYTQRNLTSSTSSSSNAVKSEVETPNIFFDVEKLSFVSLRDIHEGEDLLL
jgi:D-alanine-D-alanine ligase-like ATP-grasp enzyme